MSCPVLPNGIYMGLFPLFNYSTVLEVNVSIPDNRVAVLQLPGVPVTQFLTHQPIIQYKLLGIPTQTPKPVGTGISQSV
jgi:hypothetical protein